MFFKFKGGKGIAVTVGALYFLDIRIALIATLVFFASVYLTRIVSISSMLLTLTVPIGLLVFYRGTSYWLEAVLLGAFIAAFTAFRHKANIKRLLNGTESKLGSK